MVTRKSLHITLYVLFLFCINETGCVYRAVQTESLTVVQVNLRRQDVKFYTYLKFNFRAYCKDILFHIPSGISISRGF